VVFLEFLDVCISLCYLLQEKERYLLKVLHMLWGNLLAVGEGEE